MLLKDSGAVILARWEDSKGRKNNKKAYVATANVLIYENFIHPCEQAF
jgi:hypothetical protein